jgi:hypothetical protein
MQQVSPIVYKIKLIFRINVALSLLVVKKLPLYEFSSFQQTVLPQELIK